MDNRHPVAVLPSRQAWPLHDAAASRQLEQAALQATPAHALMARAGLATARLALAVAPHAQQVLVLAGPGNNGGDGLVAATHLRRWGRSVQVVHLAHNVAALPADAAWALRQAQAAGVTIDATLPRALHADLVIDALLGLGANRAPAGEIARAIAQINDASAPVLAVDVPSGLDAGSGHRPGEQAVRADHTLALLTLKPGLFTGEGRDHAGQVWFDALGVGALPLDIASTAPSARLSGPGDAQALMAPRAHGGHKGRFGDVVVIGGAPGMGGAVLLAADAALAAGAGRVYVARLDADAPALSEQRPALMQRPAAELLVPERLADATVVCGCGGGSAVAGVLPAVLAHAARLVLDADALNAVAADAGLRHRLRARGAHARATVITPHPLEASRLMARPVADIQADRLGHARALADELVCTVLLKGSGTVVAAPGTPACLNPTGTARLGSAGSGDVLAGWIGGLWSASGAAPPDVATAAAWLHGRAAEAAPLGLPLTADRQVAAVLAAAASL